MKINWKVRFLNVHFWLALVPAMFLVVQSVASVFGYQWNFVVLDQQVSAVINAVFAVLTILGVVTDPTTHGLGDSPLVLSRASQAVAPSSAVQVPNPNPQGQPIADDIPSVPHETPLIKPINPDDVSHETVTNKAGDANVVQH